MLPEQAGRVRRRTAYVDCAQTPTCPASSPRLARAKPDVLFLDRVEALTDPGADPDARAALARALDGSSPAAPPPPSSRSTDRSGLDTLLRGPSRVLDLRPRPALAQA